MLRTTSKTRPASLEDLLDTKLLLVFLLACHLAGCAAPWVCTPESCTQVSQEPISTQFYGDWVDADGESFTIEPIYLGSMEDVDRVEDLDVLSTVAVVNTVEGSTARLVANGGTHFAEWHVEMQGVQSRKRPRRFARVRLQGDRLLWQACLMEGFAAAQDQMPFRVVDTDGGQAIAYQDYAGMYDTMGQLVADDDLWQAPIEYKRVP